LNDNTDALWGSIVAGSEDWLEKLLNNSVDLFAVPAGKGKLEKILKKSSDFRPFMEGRAGWRNASERIVLTVRQLPRRTLMSSSRPRGSDEPLRLRSRRVGTSKIVFFDNFLMFLRHISKNCLF
jgi:hypothetical protein